MAWKAVNGTWQWEGATDMGFKYNQRSVPVCPLCSVLCRTPAPAATDFGDAKLGIWYCPNCAFELGETYLARFRGVPRKVSQSQAALQAPMRSPVPLGDRPITLDSTDGNPHRLISFED